MSILTITSKGQGTLRRDVMAHLGGRPGNKITVEKLPDGRIEVKAARPGRRISEVLGFLKRELRPSLSIDEIDQVAAAGWVGKR
jgi:hypothetical protein